MAFITQTALPNEMSPIDTDAQEQEEKQRAMQKFMARAEVSTVTRALRQRLAYASFKAAHNVPQMSLRDLEDQLAIQSQAHASPYSRTITAKRKAGGTAAPSSASYYSSPGTQGSGLRRTGSNLAPPGQRSNYYPTVNGTGSSSATIPNQGFASPSQGTAQSESLYTSLLAPPPAKHARTIHNPNDPPVAAPIRGVASPRALPRDKAAASRAVVNSPEGARARAKGRKTEKKSPGTPKTKRVSKGKKKASPNSAKRGAVDGDGDVDMKAAAALTSLLLHNHQRGSVSMSAAGSASSPRSSVDAASEAGSVTSMGQRAVRPPGDPVPSTSASAHAPTAHPPFRPRTPVSNTPSKGNAGATTPRAAPSDNEAADLMLFLATSPSPARPSGKARDMEALRVLGPSAAVRPKGRVLFPTATELGPAGATDTFGSATASQSIRGAKPLARGLPGENSFASISSIGGHMDAEAPPSTRSGPASGRSTPTPSQLLPPPTLPPTRKSSQSPDGRRSPGGQRRQAQNPYPTSSTVDFNFNEFINASPSPRSTKSSTVASNTPKANLSLRADVGRKLFEEEQIRLGSMNRGDGVNLGAGIDLST
ncbi:hypothetical protein HGRIS_003369 [Hohenbuehelia grisea]|uniref:Proteophosphoglycan 5 n=1 Tax=Hohenbuehelia grisea TaxID=104357 RepID=A0ABR3JFG4_9AGAR